MGSPKAEPDIGIEGTLTANPQPTITAAGNGGTRLGKGSGWSTTAPVAAHSAIHIGQPREPRKEAWRSG